MKTHTYQEQLLAGDVTNNSLYQKKTKDFISSTFNKAKGDTLKESEQNIKIRKISSIPTAYITCELFFEERTIFAAHTPSVFVQTNSSVIHSPDEYDMWAVKCADPEKLFSKMKNRVTISESMYLSDCNVCNTHGTLPCYCGTGYETCPSCNGYGGWNCNTCGGRGEHSCSYCNGIGYTTKLECVGYDNNNLPIYDNVNYKCHVCYGTTVVRCSNCGGSGHITCGTCHGQGNIVCRKCNGSRYVTCNYCSGCGHFLDSVNVEQCFDIRVVTNILHETPVDAAIYKGQNFRLFAPHPNDYLIYELTDDRSISQLPTDHILSNLFNQPYPLDKEMAELSNFISQKADSRKPIKYRVRIYQRDIIHAEYTFLNSDYQVIINYSTDEYIMDKNPYEDVADELLKELQEHTKQREFKSFLDKYDEFISITGFDNVSYGEKDIHPLLNKLHFSCSAVSMAAGLITQLLMALIYCTLTTTTIIFLCVLSLLAGFGISKLWKKIATDNKSKMYLLLSSFSALTSILINVLWHYIF